MFTIYEDGFADLISSAVFFKVGRTSSISFCLLYTDGLPAIFSPAITLLFLLKTGTAIEITPASISWSTNA